MSRLAPWVLVLSACFSEAQFREACVNAGHCVFEPDAGAVNTLDAGRNEGWPAVVAQLFSVEQSADSTFSLSFERAANSGGTVGGVLTPSGSVICVPYDDNVGALEVFPDAGSRTIPVSGGGWEGAVLLPDGTVLGIPYSAPGFLAIPPDGGAARVLTAGLPTNELSAPYFEGGVLTRSGQVLLATTSGTGFAVFDPARELLTPLSAVAAVGGQPKRYAGAVLLADGESALLVPRGDTSLVTLTSSTALRGAPASGLAGGLVLPNGDVMLLPAATGQRQFLRRRADGGVANEGPATTGYFSAAWSTNGYAYGLQTDGTHGNIAVIDRSGGVREVPLEPSTTAVNSHYGLVARPDGSLVGCPFRSNRVLILTPTVRRTVPLETMLSPWLNKW